MQCYETVTRTSPPWPPQSAQENWSGRRGRGNFIKAWGDSSLYGSGRVMPKQYGSRGEGIQRLCSDCTRGVSPHHVIQHTGRTKLGPTRRDPRGRFSLCTGSSSALQGASAMGSLVVSSARERQPSSARSPGTRSASFESASAWQHTWRTRTAYPQSAPQAQPLRHRATRCHERGCP